MTDEEIIRRREDLDEQSRRNSEAWQEYDRQHPVIPGAYKPPDYWDRQRWFANRGSEISAERRALPRTRPERIKRLFAMTVLLVVLVVIIAKLVLHLV